MLGSTSERRSNLIPHTCLFCWGEFREKFRSSLLTCMLWPVSQSRRKKTAGTASMLIGSTLKCWYRRLTQLHSTPITRHGKHRRRSLQPPGTTHTHTANEDTSTRSQRPIRGTSSVKSAVFSPDTISDSTTFWKWSKTMAFAAVALGAPGAQASRGGDGPWVEVTVSRASWWFSFLFSRTRDA